MGVFKAGYDGPSPGEVAQMMHAEADAMRAHAAARQAYDQRMMLQNPQNHALALEKMRLDNDQARANIGHVDAQTGRIRGLLPYEQQRMGAETGKINGMLPYEQQHMAAQSGLLDAQAFGARQAGYGIQRENTPPGVATPDDPRALGYGMTGRAASPSLGVGMASSHGTYAPAPPVNGFYYDSIGRAYPAGGGSGAAAPASSGDRWETSRGYRPMAGGNGTGIAIDEVAPSRVLDQARDRYMGVSAPGGSRSSSEFPASGGGTPLPPSRPRNMGYRPDLGSNPNAEFLAPGGGGWGFGAGMATSPGRRGDTVTGSLGLDNLGNGSTMMNAPYGDRAALQSPRYSDPESAALGRLGLGAGSHAPQDLGPSPAAQVPQGGDVMRRFNRQARFGMATEGPSMSELTSRPAIGGTAGAPGTTPTASSGNFTNGPFSTATRLY